MVNSIGVDINEVVKHKHLSGQLQFVCGLGPRKSLHIIESISHQVGRLKMRFEFWAFKIIEKTVYTNAIGFLKVIN